MLSFASVIVTSLALFLPADGGHQSPASTPPSTERAQVHYRLGWEAIASEAWADAVKEFQQATEIDRTFKLAYYGLGRAYMGLKKFPDAVEAYESCRGLYEAQAGNNFKNRQDADQMRRDDLFQLQTAINSMSSRRGNQAAQTSNQTQVQQLRGQMQRIQLQRDQDRSYSIVSPAPSFVSLALGSAYLRQNLFSQAEQAYRASLDDDPKSGETHNNLAVLYMLTSRFDESVKEVSLAEKCGYHVNPQFKKDLEDRVKGKS